MKQFRHYFSVGFVTPTLIFTLLPIDVYAGGDWNKSWNFQSDATRSRNLAKADLVKKAESGYYDGLGKVNVTNNDYSENYDNSTDNSTSNDNREGTFQDSNTTSIGAIDSSTSTVNVDGEGNNEIIIENSSTNEGALSSDINYGD